MLVELVATPGEQLLEALLGSRPGREDPADESATRLVAIVVVRAYCLHRSASVRECRRIDPKPSCLERSAGSTRLRRSSGESCSRHSPERVKGLARETDTSLMDTQGARLLAARIRAGVAVGARIELVEAPRDDSGLCAGDRGVVEPDRRTGSRRRDLGSRLRHRDRSRPHSDPHTRRVARGCRHGSSDRASSVFPSRMPKSAVTTIVSAPPYSRGAVGA